MPSALCAQTAAFGEQLQSWAHGLQTDCAQLQQSLDRPARPAGDGRELLRGMERDIAGLGAAVAQVRDGTFGDGTTLSSALQSALQFQSESETLLAQVERQLQQYGYVPVAREPSSADAAEPYHEGDEQEQEHEQEALDEQDEQEAHEQDEQEEQEEQEEEEEDMDPLAVADAMEPEDDSPSMESAAAPFRSSSPAPMMAPFPPATPSPARAPLEQDLPRTPRLEDFGLGDIAAKYGLVTDNDDVVAPEPAPAPAPAPTPSPAAAKAADLIPRQSPRLLAAKQQRQSSPMEKVFARASSPSPLKVLNRTDSHGLTDLKARLSAASGTRAAGAD